MKQSDTGSSAGHDPDPASTALARSEERFRRLTELSSDWYWEQDAEYQFVHIAGADTATRGGPGEDYLGHTLWRMATVRPPQQGWAAHQEIVQAQLPFHDLELQLDDQAGRARWLSLSGLPLFSAGGQFIGYHGIGRDISAAKQAASVRQEALDRLEKIAGRLPGMVYQYRLRVDGSACYPFASAAIRDVYGLDPSDVRESGAAIMDMLHPDDRDRLKATVSQSAQDLTPWSAEYRIRRPDGSQRWLLGSAVPEREAGGSTLWNGFTADITERKTQQELIVAALREKSVLLQEVHHRVKNNLQVVMSLLRLESRRSADAAVTTVLDDMQGRIRAMALLHESLYRSGIFASTDLNVYLRELGAQLFRVMAANEQLIRLELELEPVHVALHQGTPIGLIANELISNCFKHAFPDGRAGTVRMSLQRLPETARLCLRVSDDGVGFPDDFASRHKRSLGLQLVEDLTQQLDGTLEIGPGSMVTLSFTPDPLPTITDEEA